MSITLPTQSHILILRHGESEGNAQKIMQGNKEYALSEKGIHQAILAQSAISTLGVKYFVASNLSRSINSVKLLSGNPETKIIVDERLTERGAGIWEGKPRHLLNEAYPGALEDDSLRPEDFESEVDVLGRIFSSLKDFSNYDGLVLIVGHGGTMRLLDKTLGGTGERFKNFDGLILSKEIKLLGRITGILENNEANK